MELAETLANLFPGDKPAKCFFTNSGTEANETAILPRACTRSAPR